MAMIDDQETLQIFLEDAREHLRGIEEDFLAIEAAGSAVDVAWSTKCFAPFIRLREERAS